MEEKQFPFIEQDERARKSTVRHTGEDALAFFPEEDGDRLGLHLAKPYGEFAKDNDFWLNPLINGHVAISVKDIQKVKENLDRMGITYMEPGEYVTPGRYQIYLYDPSMNVLEINEWSDADE